MALTVSQSEYTERLWNDEERSRRSGEVASATIAEQFSRDWLRQACVEMGIQ